MSLYTRWKASPGPMSERFFAHVLEPTLAHLRAIVRARELEPVRLRPELGPARFVVVLVVQNEMLRVPFLLEYYRRLGFEHFIFIDNKSTDGLAESLSEDHDVSVVRADGGFKAAHFGFDWINAVCRRHLRGKWVLCVDADEHIVFSGVQRRIDALTSELDRLGKRSLQTMMLDMYSARSPRDNEVPAGTDPLAVCPLYDRSGYLRRRNATTGTTWIKGGVRGRVFFAEDPWAGPALNKSPLVKWRLGDCFVKSTHHLWPCSLNGEGQTNGLLLHFKFTRMSVSRMVAESFRVQHSEEYLRYDTSEDEILVDDGVTATMTDATDLVHAGLFVPLVPRP